MGQLAPLSKIKIIIKYFCENTDPRFLGKVKLMKLFYFLDFIHVKKYGIPITYDRYYHLELGPVPTVIKNMVDAVDENIDDAELADTIQININPISGMHRIECTKKLNEYEIKVFTKSELQVLQEVCARFYDKNKQFIVNESHKEAGWSKTNYLQEIPYELAYLDSDNQLEKDELNS